MSLELTWEVIISAVVELLVGEFCCSEVGFDFKTSLKEGDPFTDSGESWSVSRFQKCLTQSIQWTRIIEISMRQPIETCIFTFDEIFVIKNR